MNGISVIICCHNSSWVIERALTALSVQELPVGCSMEILVVDNASTDSTREVVEKFKAAHPAVPIIVIGENRPGLSFARVTGLQHATHETIVYCDDDNLLHPDYLKNALAVMHMNPEVGLIGGCGVPVFEAPPDQRIVPFLDRYATGPQGNEYFCDVTARGFVYGAGMVIRRRALREIFSRGFRYFSAGRKGSVLTGGEDVELGHAIKDAGYRIYYSGNLRYDHVLRANRLTWNYLCRMARGNGYSSVLMAWPSTIMTPKSHPVYVAVWTVSQTFARAMPILLRTATDEDRLKFEGILGSINALRKEFFTLFQNRIDARNYFSGKMLPSEKNI